MKMKYKNIILITLLLLSLAIGVGAVSASQDNATVDELTVNENIDIESSVIDEVVAEDSDNEIELENTNEDNLTDDEGEFVDPSEGYAYLNAFRTEEGVWQWNNDDATKTVFNTNSTNQLKPLIIDSALEETAKTRAKEMAEAGEMSHTRPNGEDCWTAFPDGLWAKGENIAMGQTSPKQVTEAWKETNYQYSGQGHRRNMLNSNFNSVGIAGYKLNGIIYWAQDFGKYSNVADLTVTKPAEAFSITNNTSNPEFKLSLPSDATGNFTLRVNGSVIDTKSLTSGNATITATGLTEGTHEALLSYSGDSKYATINQVVSFNVKNDETTFFIGTEIYAPDIKMTYGDSTNLTITLKLAGVGTLLSGISGKNITVNLNGKKTYTTNSEGQVSVPISLTAGNYTAYFSFDGDDFYSSASGSAKIEVQEKSNTSNDNKTNTNNQNNHQTTIKKQSTKITAKKATFKAKKKSKKYTITLKAGKKAVNKVAVYLKIGKKTYKAITKSNAKAIFNIKLNKKGKYSATITFKGNQYYNKATKKVKIVIK